MHPTLSEFSYGYAVTEELINGAQGPIRGAPVFPSLVAEAGLGYDVQIPLNGAPLFLQFKLSDKLVRTSAAETNQLGVPYYRFHLRSRRHSSQHELLQQWQASGEEVYYIAPLFHSHEELNEAYTSQSVWNSSALFEPLDIDITDDDDHHVSFAPNSAFYLVCSSDPKAIQKPTQAPQVAERMAPRLRKRSRTTDQEFFAEVSRKLIGFAKEEGMEMEMFETKQFVGRRDRSRSSEAQFAAFLSRSLLGAELFIVET